MNTTALVPGLLEDARELHRAIPVFAPYFEYYGPNSLFLERGGAQCDLEKLRDAGITAFGIAVTNGGAPYFEVAAGRFEVAGPDDWVRERTLRNFAAAMERIRACPGVSVALSASDLSRGTQNGTVQVIPLVTGHRYMTDLDVLDEMFALGLRISHCSSNFCTTWNRAAPAHVIAGKTAPVFTDFGRAAVERMNELGIVIDVAHMSDESTLAVIEASSKPVIDGHTCSQDAVPSSARGHRDHALRVIADSGGVVGVHFADHLYTEKVWGLKYLRADNSKATQPEPRLWKYNRHLLETVHDPEERSRLRKNRQAQQDFFEAHGLAEEPKAPLSGHRLATVADMADQVDYLVNVCGIEAVGLGGDVNGIDAHSWPLGMDHVGELPHLTAELLRRGWNEDAIEKFLSRNWYRVMGECLPQ